MYKTIILLSFLMLFGCSSVSGAGSKRDQIEIQDIPLGVELLDNKPIRSISYNDDNKVEECDDLEPVLDFIRFRIQQNFKSYPPYIEDEQGYALFKLGIDENGDLSHLMLMEIVGSNKFGYYGKDAIMSSAPFGNLKNICLGTRKYLSSFRIKLGK